MLPSIRTLVMKGERRTHGIAAGRRIGSRDSLSSTHSDKTVIELAIKILIIERGRSDLSSGAVRSAGEGTLRGGSEPCRCPSLHNKTDLHDIRNGNARKL